MFNDYIWKTYLKAGGQAVVDMFERNITKSFSEEYMENISEFRKSYCPCKSVVEEMQEQLSAALEDISEGVYCLEDGEYTISSALEYLFNDSIINENLSAKEIFVRFSENIEYYTVFLTRELPDLFVPYHFKYNFNVLEKIAQEFDIEIPPMPVKKDYERRFYYYGELCVALFKFRERNNLSSYELCAFLYDFAPKYIGGIESYIISELPKPKSAYFIGASQDDIFLDDYENDISCWQCSPDTRAGDMVVMYLKTPVSAIDSVGQSVSIGFNDPFFYYYRCTYITRLTKIKRVTQKELEKDVIFKDVPIVRKNMQGINGVELLPSQYNHLIDITDANAPQIEFAISDDNLTFTCEKDVENKLVKPLIAKLGYSGEDYLQQMQIKVGNNNFKLIPDFVILPMQRRGHYSAYFLVEAKLSIQTNSYLEEVKSQARSYAKQLGAKYSVIASKEKIWVTSPVDDFDENIFTASWDELGSVDVFSTLYKLLGKDK